MSSRNDRFTIRFAVPSDNDSITEVFESEHFEGGLSVQYLRPSPVESFAADGEEGRIIIVDDNENGRTAGVGGAVVSTMYIGGRQEKCAYLTGLKIHRDYRKKQMFIPGAYRFLGDSLTDCRCCYSTVLDDNAPVIKMLEKRRKNMPEYRYLGHYMTYCFCGAKRILDLEKNDMTGFDKLNDSYFSRLDLTPASADIRGLGDKTFYSLRKDGKIIACCFAGGQSATKQYRMSSYGGIYRVLSVLPVKLLGYPEFPKAGSIISHSAVSFLYIKDNDPKLCRDFLRTVAYHDGHALLIWGGFETHPLIPAMDKLRAVHYGSRLYEIVWKGREAVLSRDIGMEAALL